MDSYVADVYEIINDIAACILGEKSEFLALSNLDIVHCLEMVESVLAGNSSILCRDELHLASAVRENLLPALVKKFGEKQNYSVYSGQADPFRAWYSHTTDATNRQW